MSKSKEIRINVLVIRQKDIKNSKTIIIRREDDRSK